MVVDSIGEKCGGCGFCRASLMIVARVQTLILTRSDALVLSFPQSTYTCITPSTYVYTSFVSDLALAKSVAVGKSSRQTLLFDS